MLLRNQCCLLHPVLKVSEEPEINKNRSSIAIINWYFICPIMHIQYDNDVNY
jgi:hypothetical protein